MSSTVKTGFLAFIRQNPQIDAIVTAIIGDVSDQWVADARIAAQFLGALYAEGLLWQFVKLIAPQLGWYGATELFAKLIEYIFAPEAVVELFASMMA